MSSIRAFTTLTYSNLTVQHAIAVTRITGSAAAICRAGTVTIESAVRSAPNSTLPIFRYGLIFGLAWREVEAVLARTVSRLCRNTRPDVSRTVVGDKQRCNV
jgi:hypothetical protein